MSSSLSNKKQEEYARQRLADSPLKLKKITKKELDAIEEEDDPILSYEESENANS